MKNLSRIHLVRFPFRIQERLWHVAENAGRFLCCVLAAWVVLGALPLKAQLPGNASLQGAYYVRYLGVDTDNNPQSFQGTLTFDGKGGFQVSGQGASNATSNHSLKILSSGDYEVLSSGVVHMLNPFYASGKTRLHGGIGAGILIAGSRNSPYDDFLVAVPAGTSASNATLSGTYRVATLDFLNGDLLSTRGTFFPMTADGKGGLGDVTIKGTALNLKNAPTVQTSPGATYSLGANGSGTLNLPAPSGAAANQQLLAGNKTLYVSPDGSVFLAGSASTYDMIVGVKAYSGNTPNQSLQGLYFRSYLEQISAGPALGDQSIWDGEGVVNEISALKLEIGSENINYWDSGSGTAVPLDEVWSQDFPLAADGTSPDSAKALGAGGNIAIGGNPGNIPDDYYLTLRVKAPAMSGSGVFLNPQAVVNAASNAPFTAQVAPGEFISLYGSGLASQTATAATLSFPTTLGGIQVTINGTPAPLYYVSPTQISAVVPYSIPTDGSFLKVQVNNGGASNIVQVYSGFSSPGIFTIPSGGIGNGAILHSADYSVVTPANPAKVGETVLIFLTGMGPVAPSVPAGTPGPISPLSRVAGEWDVSIDGVDASPGLLYAGLAPNFSGLYQMNVTIPQGVSTGNVTLEIFVGPAGASFWDTDHTLATIPIGK